MSSYGLFVVNMLQLRKAAVIYIKKYKKTNKYSYGLFHKFSKVHSTGDPSLAEFHALHSRAWQFPPSHLIDILSGSNVK